jgi:hypothetical protein
VQNYYNLIKILEVVAKNWCALKAHKILLFKGLKEGKG